MIMNGHWLRGVARRSTGAVALPRSALMQHSVRSFSSSDSKRSGKNVAAIQNTPHLKRKLGQHLLVTEKILDQIVDAAELPAILRLKQATLDAEIASAAAAEQEQGENSQSEPLHKDGSQAIVRVLEIGPGTGNLTSALLNISPNIHLHCVEFDARMVERLNDRFREELDESTKRLTLENIDFEDFQFAKLLEIKTPTAAKPSSRRVSIRGRGKARERATAAAAAALENERRHFDACVANIPYQLSSIIISRLTNYMYRFPDRMKCAVLLVQEEFAQRLLAKPSTQNYSRLSVNTALVADIVSVVPVGKEHFLPPPKVDSRVIKITPKRRELSEVPTTADEERFFQRFDTLLRIAFTRKNKTLRAALVSSTALSLMEKDTQAQLTKDEIKAHVEAALEATGLASKRAVQLPVHDFKQLMDALASRGIVFRVSETRHFRD